MTRTFREIRSHGPARFARGQKIEVRVPNHTPYSGVVTTVKFSPISGWLLDVDAGAGATWVVSEDFVVEIGDER